MKNSDTPGHKSRSRAAFYAIANEFIASLLAKNQFSYTDLVTLIEMREKGCILSEIYMEPITWELYNKIVLLAQQPYRAGGHGHFIPSIQLAMDCL